MSEGWSARRVPLGDTRGEPFTLLVPRRDMEAYGVARDIDSDVMFAAWFDGIPLRDFGARILVRFIFLAR